MKPTLPVHPWDRSRLVLAFNRQAANAAVIACGLLVLMACLLPLDSFGACVVRAVLAVGGLVQSIRAGWFYFLACKFNRDIP